MAVWSIVQESHLTPDLRLDSEYHRPEYVDQEEKIERHRSRPLGEVAHVSDGNHLTISDQFTIDGGVRYLRGQDLTDFFISDLNPVYIPWDAYHTLKRSHIQPNDVLLSIVGTIGSVSLVMDKYAALTGSCKIAILRPHSINPYVLAAYLASPTGQHQLLRQIRGAVQQGLILPDVRLLQVPTVSKRVETDVELLIGQTRERQQESESLYRSADRLLLHALGIPGLDLTHQTSYTSNWNTVEAANRLDAEYFQPKYGRVRRALLTAGLTEIVPLERMLDVLTNGHTPLHHDLETGEVPFLTAEHVADFRIDINSEKRVRLAHHNDELRSTQLHDKDLLLTIKGRVGNAAIVENVAGPLNINQDVALLRLKPGYHPYYIAGYLNSPAGKAFVEQMGTGQINPFLGLGNVRRLPIPLLGRERMDDLGQRIQETVQQAEQAHGESKRFLNEAKAAIEQEVLAR